MKTRKKINPYKVLRLVGILCAVAFVCYCTINGTLFSEESHIITAEESRQLRQQQLRNIAADKEQQEIAAQERAARIAAQEAAIQQRIAADKARSEKERAEFIQHRRDPHGPVTVE